MQPLNIPSYPFKIFKEGEKYKILDPIRNKRLILTPEEWVRQHVIMFLVNEKEFPKGLLRIETGVRSGQRSGRTDAVFYNRGGNPLLLVECKAPNVKLGPETFHQVARYNGNLEAQYILLTNGLEHIFMNLAIQEKQILTLSKLPLYKYL
ncbi:MAG: type I restriction enzyme HsdR N-terminal domain-containing protein [Flavobacteriales bacterium]|nr:type I restriction enzyme HsdR N-terminal domain-containing protein [Flavobacteriales bacterium]